MKSLTRKQQAQIRKLSKAGKSQGQIARTIHKQKLVVSKYMQAEGIGKRVQRGSTIFWKEVKVIKQTLGVPHKEATEIVFKSSKWHTKRMERLPELRRLAAEKWEELGAKARKKRFEEFKRGDFKEQTGVNPEDYEDYFDTPR